MKRLFSLIEPRYLHRVTVTGIAIMAAAVILYGKAALLEIFA